MPSASEEIDTLGLHKLEQRKLRDIQLSLMSSGRDGKIHPFVLSLSDFNSRRSFVIEADLEKVCRNVNKAFHFWLFNDCIIYGTLLVNGRYQFVKKIDLISCTIAAFPSIRYEHAMSIWDDGKPFVVIAPTEYIQQEWLHHTSVSINTLGGSPTSMRSLNVSRNLPQRSGSQIIRRNDWGIDMYEDTTQNSFGAQGNGMVMRDTNPLNCTLCGQVSCQSNRSIESNLTDQTNPVM